MTLPMAFCLVGIDQTEMPVEGSIMEQAIQLWVW
jgi:hypothetical protein